MAVVAHAEPKLVLAADRVARGPDPVAHPDEDPLRVATTVGADEVPKFRAVRDRYVNAAKPPASTLVVVTRLARPGWLIEIEAVAAIG